MGTLEYSMMSAPLHGLLAGGGHRLPLRRPQLPVGEHAEEGHLEAFYWSQMEVSKNQGPFLGVLITRIRIFIGVYFRARLRFGLSYLD